MRYHEETIREENRITQLYNQRGAIGACCQLADDFVKLRAAIKALTQTRRVEIMLEGGVIHGITVPEMVEVAVTDYDVEGVVTVYAHEQTERIKL